jgi:hypothetical protein
LRFKDDWFDPLSPTALSETQFEDLLIQNPDVFRASSWMVRFKKTIYSAEGSARADLAIIDRDYREWFVVEVEMARHSLYGHVLPQVRTLRDGFYGQAEADYLAERLPAANSARVADLVRGKSPRIVVIADRASQDWGKVLAGADIDFMTLEVFKSELNAYIFSVDGGLPQRAHDLVSYCAIHPMLPRQLIVESPASLGIAANERLAVLWEGQVIEWVRMDSGDSCYLRTRGPVQLKTGIRYALLSMENGQIELRAVG